MSDFKRIHFKGHGDFILIEDEEGGAIATVEAYENFDDSYAHWYRNDGPNGCVMRYRKMIGTNDDIVFLDGTTPAKEAPVHRVLERIVDDSLLPPKGKGRRAFA